MTPEDQFKKELKELLKKWNAEITPARIWVDTPNGPRRQTMLYAYGHAPCTGVPDFFDIELGQFLSGDDKEEP